MPEMPAIPTLGRFMLALLSFALVVPLGCSQDESPTEKSLTRRPLVTEVDGKWIGNAIGYSPYREGQRPGGTLPTQAQVIEDLKILAPRWQMIRTYGSTEARLTLEAIKKAKLGIRVMIGAWLDGEVEKQEDGSLTPRAAGIAANEREIDAIIALANAYPKTVAAVSVGNETQVFWTGQPVPGPALIAHVKKVRQATKVPVTVADDFNFRTKPESQAVAAELDFIVTHIHPH
ncbi:MAG: hypothetical protein KDB53_05800, partial [Planctomycetes bacterium]|nr:hypothetical protein [Planctomycetota bacterium]